MPALWQSRYGLAGEQASSQRKSKVMVIAESTPIEKEPEKGQKPKVVKHIKMIMIPDDKAKQ